VSIFRTAYSAHSPPALARRVVEEFGHGRGLLICTADDAKSAGLHYKPQYVLTEDQITWLFLGARSIVLGLFSAPFVEMQVQAPSVQGRRPSGNGGKPWARSRAGVGNPS